MINPVYPTRPTSHLFGCAHRADRDLVHVAQRLRRGEPLCNQRDGMQVDETGLSISLVALLLLQPPRARCGRGGPGRKREHCPRHKRDGITLSSRPARVISLVVSTVASALCFLSALPSPALGPARTAPICWDLTAPRRVSVLGGPNSAADLWCFWRSLLPFLTCIMEHYWTLKCKTPRRL